MNRKDEVIKLRELFYKLRSLQAGDEEGTRRGEDNVDAMGASMASKADPQGGLPGAVPPNYIKTYDDGRPGH